MNDAIPLTPDAPMGVQPDRDVMTEVLVEQLRLGYTHLPVSQTVALVNGLVLAFVLSFAAPPARVGAWLTVFVAVTLARLLLHRQFRRASPTASEMPLWRTYYLAGAAASGLAWGAAAVLLYPPTSLVHQIFIAFVLGGMVVGGMAALTPVFSAFALFATGALAPAIARFVLVGDYVHSAMAGMGALLLVAMLVLARHIHETMTESLKLRFENRDLVAYLMDQRKDLVSINRDLRASQSELTRANEALESRVAERTAALQAADQRKDEFLAVLSHELRNPLAPIRNSIYILNHVDADSEQARHALDIIERQTQHITRLVDDLLDVTRIARGKVELRRESADLVELVGRTVEDYAAVFAQLGIELVTKMPERPVRTAVDVTRIAQVIGNLLQNASKFTPAGGRVELAFEARDGYAELRVRDTGAGIDPVLLPSLFTPFMQGQQSLARTEGGLGLGLSLVKGIIELHGGVVRVESAGVGKGASFIIVLPLTAGDTSQPGPAAAAPATQHRRVLVVDDNCDAADSLAQLVAMFGHTAEVAYDGASALAEARLHPPDVVLCDLGLPGLTGYDVARALRADGSAVRLVAVSGYAQPDDIARASAAGFESHIAKPPDPEAVRALLQ